MGFDNECWDKPAGGLSLDGSSRTFRARKAGFRRKAAQFFLIPDSQLSRINFGRHPIGCPSASCGNTGSFINLRASPIT
jgi:hypothetical protein